jgi:hypothetical protein
MPCFAHSGCAERGRIRVAMLDHAACVEEAASISKLPPCLPRRKPPYRVLPPLSSAAVRNLSDGSGVLGHDIAPATSVSVRINKR